MPSKSRKNGKSKNRKRGAGPGRKAMVPSNALVVVRSLTQGASAPRSGRARVRSSGGMSSLQNRTLKHMLSMCDPFDPTSRGCLRHDSYVAPRLPLRCEQLLKITTAQLDAAGCIGLWYFPSFKWNYQFVLSTSGAGSTWVAPSVGDWSAIANSQPDGNAYSNGRINCAGLRMRVNLPATATYGTCVVTEVYEPGNSSEVIGVGNMNGGNVRAFSLVPGLEIELLSRPLGPSAQLPQTVAPVTAQPNFGAFSGFFIQLYGLPTSGGGGIDFHFAMNTELFVDDVGVLAQYIPPQPKPSPFLETLKDRVQAEVGGIVHSGVSAVGGVLRNRIASALAGALGAAGGPMGRLAGAAAPLMIHDLD